MPAPGRRPPLPCARSCAAVVLRWAWRGSVPPIRCTLDAVATAPSAPGCQGAPARGCQSFTTFLRAFYITFMTCLAPMRHTLACPGGASGSPGVSVSRPCGACARKEVASGHGRHSPVGNVMCGPAPVRHPGGGNGGVACPGAACLPSVCVPETATPVQVRVVDQIGIRVTPRCWSSQASLCSRPDLEYHSWWQPAAAHAAAQRSDRHFRAAGFQDHCQGHNRDRPDRRRRITPAPASSQ
jgi:hypothetical protein